MSAKYNTWPSDTFAMKSHKIGRMGYIGYSNFTKKVNSIASNVYK